MIYFGVETKRSSVHRMIDGMLRPGGYLILSHSETLNGMSTAGLQTGPPSIYRPGDGDR